METTKTPNLQDSTHDSRIFVEEGEAFSRLSRSAPREALDVIVIGAGQTGLSLGYFLARRGVRFVVLEASARVGDVWRKRWDSLRLFTPARFDSLAGMPFPAPAHYFPTKDEMADYLESYAAKFSLPVKTGVRVERLSKQGGRYLVETSNGRFEAAHVVVAMATYQRPRVPAFAEHLGSDVVRLHSSEYRNPSQLKKGGVLVVGAGNSGAEIAFELVKRGHQTWVSGPSTGEVPFRIHGILARLFLIRLVLRVLFHRILTIKTPVGRKAQKNFIRHGAPLLRVQSKELAAAGVQRVPRVVGVQEGRPVLQDGRSLDVANVIWCTGFHPGFSWIDLPIFDENREPIHDGGVVATEPGLYFAGLNFLYAASSTMVHGAERDAERIAGVIVSRIATAKAQLPRIGDFATAR